MNDSSTPSSSPRPIPAGGLSWQRYIPLVVGALITMALDIGTKAWALKRLQEGMLPFVSWRPVLIGRFSLAYNPGAAWSLLGDAPAGFRQPFFILVVLAAIVLLVTLYRRTRLDQPLVRWGLALVLGGALGNLSDRLRFGHVIDFIQVAAEWGGALHPWPTFNVADIGICVGIGLMAIDSLRRNQAERSVPLAP